MDLDKKLQNRIKQVQLNKLGRNITSTTKIIKFRKINGVTEVSKPSEREEKILETP